MMKGYERNHSAIPALSERAKENHQLMGIFGSSADI
jgi:hypothetical protein